MSRIRFGPSLHRLLAVLLPLTLLAAACDGDGGPSSVAPTGRPPAASAAPSVEPSEEPATTTTALRLWFTQEEFAGLTSRLAEVTPPRFGTAAVEELLAGPNAEEASVGFGTAIPEGARLHGLTVEDGLATADLSSEFESGGGSLSMRLRLAQLVLTLTEFSTVDAVAIEIDGEPVDVFSSEGIVIEDPLTRDEFEDVMAPIVVEEPAAGDELSGSVVVSGTANVFEATVSMRVVDASGNELVEAFTTATCGTGCRGTYRKKMSFHVDAAQDGFVEVFESSAEDGSPIHVVRVPVVLLP
ncbi:MAG: GerMN domain-containing protein [Actinomycetota bacterium]|nr:GerMN domain-containing protein [Actinomycetota bacterium]